MKRNFLIRVLVDRFYGLYRSSIRHPKLRWLVILGSLFYLAGPIDLSPDIFPVIGWIDDGLIATVLVSEVSQMLLDRRKQNNVPSENELNSVAAIDS